MAGRPKTMARRLGAIEERVHQICFDLQKLRPRQYAKRAGNEGDGMDLGWWWNEACRAQGMASVAVGILLARIEERAGLDWEATEREREERRGLWDDESADEGAEKAERAAT